MRLKTLALSTFLIAASAGGMNTMAASPDCARWIREYQQSLAKRAVLAKKHVTHAVHRVAAVLPKPKPKLLRASIPMHIFRAPRLSPEEMLKRFRVLCGEDLPSDDAPMGLLPVSTDTAMLPSISSPSTTVDDGGAPSLARAMSTAGEVSSPALTSSNNGFSGFGGNTFGGTPITNLGGTTGGGTTNGGTSGGSTGGGTTGGGTTGGGTSGGGGTTGNPGGGGSTGSDPSAPSPVPEPASIWLLATGLVAIVPIARRMQRT